MALLASTLQHAAPILELPPQQRPWLLKHWLLCLLDRGRRFTTGMEWGSEWRGGGVKGHHLPCPRASTPALLLYQGDLRSHESACLPSRLPTRLPRPPWSAAGQSLTEALSRQPDLGPLFVGLQRSEVGGRG